MPYSGVEPEPTRLEMIDETTKQPGRHFQYLIHVPGNQST